MDHKQDFCKKLTDFVDSLKTKRHFTTNDGWWTIRAFIDSNYSVYPLVFDTKLISKILEIQLLPEIFKFARNNGYRVELTKHQNYYPDMSFVKEKENNIKYAVDFKTTYRKPQKPYLCNGFTLGSYGTYFKNQKSTKNIQYPYGEYSGHFCLGIIYDRMEELKNSEYDSYRLPPTELRLLPSPVIKNLQFFVMEKWRIASDIPGSGNTANIGSIKNIDDIINGRGSFSQLGENWFNDYWSSYDSSKNGNKMTLKAFVAYRGGDVSLVVDKQNNGE